MDAHMVTSHVDSILLLWLKVSGRCWNIRSDGTGTKRLTSMRGAAAPSTPPLFLQLVCRGQKLLDFLFKADTHTDTAAKWLIKKKTGQDFCICPCRRWETTYGVNKVLQKLWQIAKRHIYSFFVCLHSSYKHTPNPYNLFPTEWKSSENISKKCFISKAFLLRLPVNIGNNYRKSVGTLQQHPIYGFRTLFLEEIVF